MAGATAVLTVEGVEQVEGVKGADDGERLCPVGSVVGRGSGEGGERVVVTSSERPFGGEGMNNCAPTFKGFSDPSPPNGSGVLVRVCSPKLSSRDGDVRHRSSCRLFDRGRTVPTFPPRASSESERVKGLVSRLMDRPLESKERGPECSSASSKTGQFRIASWIWREGGRLSAGGSCLGSNCAALTLTGADPCRSPLFPARLRSPKVKEC